MEQADVVTAFLRADHEILIGRRPETAPTFSGQWGAVSGYIEAGESINAAAVREVREEVSLTVDDPVRVGDPMPVEDPASGHRFTVHPLLFDVESRAAEPNHEFERIEWVQPTAILRRNSVPGLWAGYRRVAPTIESIAADETHGAAALSRRALEVLRDRAGAIATGYEEDSIVSVGAQLREVRPSMAVVRNRINRALAAGGSDPVAVEQAAIDGLARADRVDAEAATTATTLANDANIMTLSWSGTVRQALEVAESVAVAVSQPGEEGINLAETLAAETTVSIYPDSAMAAVLADRPIDCVLVGADTILPDGDVLNKVGTHLLALAAAEHEVPVYVAAASDKVAPEPIAPSNAADPTTVYSGTAAITVDAPIFETTPASLITGYATENGVREDVSAIADAHRDRAQRVAAIVDTT